MKAVIFNGARDENPTIAAITAARTVPIASNIGLFLQSVLFHKLIYQAKDYMTSCYILISIVSYLLVILASYLA